MNTVFAALCWLGLAAWCPEALPEYPPAHVPAAEPPTESRPPAGTKPMRTARPAGKAPVAVSHFPSGCPVKPPGNHGEYYARAALRHPSLSDACDLAKQGDTECRFERGLECVDAVGGAGEVGVAQFRPATAAELGVDPAVPASAIDGQARYVAWCQGPWSRVGRTDSDIRGLGLVCYNWGRGAGFRGQRRDGWYSVCEALPHVPPITRHYVTRIEAPAC